MAASQDQPSTVPVTAGSRNSALRGPLHEALGDELRTLDLRIAQAFQILAIGGIVGGLLVYFVLGFDEGPAVAALSAVGLVWFTAHHAWLKRSESETPIRVGMVVEALAPPIFLAAIAHFRSGADALGSYVPPMLFAGVIVAAITRLRTETTVFIGTFNMVAFLGIYFIYIRDILTPEELSRPLLSTGMQVVRALSFGLAGLLGALVTQALRRAIGRAERNVRSHDLFGKYRLEERIGAGGMGAVHRAVYCPEGGFERVVAVKLLHGHLADKPEFIKAFREEAELSARLVHPNVVQVLDFGRYDTAYFLAMEYVEGITLSSLIRRASIAGKPLDASVGAWIAQQLLDGLDFSHEGARDREGGRLRVVHRDLCPSNILVSTSGEVKISDFGIAKALGDATFSETKTIAGHAGYMAPEQVRAEPIDERCDLFAVGVILWELLAVESLFRRGTDGLTAIAVLNHEVPSIASRRADLDEGWDDFFDKSLAVHPSDRFQSAGEMSAALAKLSDPSVPKHDDVAALVAWVRSLDTDGVPAEPAALTLPTELDSSTRKAM
ncbi:MAG: serine/threonine protein kinase [Polyangiaceae bacterium]|nr:serine/threonine protein kinase [Polyangiaceae bacterium]